MAISYKKVMLEDEKDVQIKLSFPLAYDFMNDAIIPQNIQRRKSYRTDFDLLQVFDTPNNNKKKAEK